MAGDIIRPSALPDRPTPVGTEKVPTDNGVTVGGTTWEAGVAAGRPLANQAEAETGVNATKAMTPLTTKQAIAAQGDVRFASAAQGALADAAVQPSRTISAGTGLTGGGDLSANRTVALNASSIASLANADSAVQSVVAGTNVTIDNTDPQNPVINATGGGAKPFPQGRLSLTSGVAFPASPVAGATTIYYEPVLGTAISIYDGAAFVVKDLAGAILLALDSNSGHAGYQQADRNFDLFVFDDGGTIRLATGPAWNAGAVSGSDTARGTGAGSTELETFGGLLVNKNAITLRWGSASGNTASVSVRRATYVGSFRATANGQASDTLTKRFLFNAYNQTVRKLYVADPVASYSYAGGYRQFNGNAANRIDFLLGLAGILVTATVNGYVSTADVTPGTAYVKISIDSTSAMNTDDIIMGAIAGRSAAQSLWGQYSGYPGLGHHFLVPIEAMFGGTTMTWYGTDNGANTVRPGLIAQVWM